MTSFDNVAFLEGHGPVWVGDFVIYKMAPYRVVHASRDSITITNLWKKDETHEIRAPFTGVRICGVLLEALKELFSAKDYGGIAMMTMGKFENPSLADGTILDPGVLVAKPEHPLLRVLFVYPGNHHRKGVVFTRDILTGKGVKFHEIDDVKAADLSSLCLA